jgi:hypothetical protein
MNRFRKLTHTIYECKYHIVFCPKYRYRILKDEILEYCRQQIYHLVRGKELVNMLELNIQADNIVFLLLTVVFLTPVCIFLRRGEGTPRRAGIMHNELYLFQYHHSPDLVKFGSGGDWVGFDSAEIDAGAEAVCVELTGVVSRRENFISNGTDCAA